MLIRYPTKEGNMKLLVISFLYEKLNHMLHKGRSPVYLSIHSFVLSFACPFVHSFIRSFVYSFIHSFIHSFIYLFIIYLFIYIGWLIACLVGWLVDWLVGYLFIFSPASCEYDLKPRPFPLNKTDSGALTVAWPSCHTDRQTKLMLNYSRVNDQRSIPVRNDITISSQRTDFVCKIILKLNWIQLLVCCCCCCCCLFDCFVCLFFYSFFIFLIHHGIHWNVTT